MNTLEKVAYRYYHGQLTETQLNWWMNELGITKQELEDYIQEQITKEYRSAIVRQLKFVVLVVLALILAITVW